MSESRFLCGQYGSFLAWKIEPMNRITIFSEMVGHSNLVLHCTGSE